MSAPHVTFWFGAASRYSYLAASRLAEITARTGARFDWVPLDVTRVFERRGLSPFAPPASGQYEAAWRAQDARRWAALYGLPFHEPGGRLALDMAVLARACTCAWLLGAAAPYGLALMRRVFAVADGRVDLDGCIDAAREVGLGATRFADLLADPASDRAVDDNVRHALAQGVFGVPAFVVDGQAFWGNDRLPLLEHHLRTR